MGLLAYGLIALAVLGTLSGIGYKIHHAGYIEGTTEIQAKWDTANAEARRREAELSAFAAKALADERKRKKVVVQERTVYVDKIVDRPVYRNQCLDADGLRCLNAAIGGESPAGCKLDGAMPAPAAPDRNRRTLGLALDDWGGGRLQRLRGE